MYRTATLPLSAAHKVGHAVGGLLAFTPTLFAGVTFVVTFSRSAQPDRDFGANVAAAMTGGLAENASMLLGFRYLGLVVIAMYGLSWVFADRTGRR